MLPLLETGLPEAALDGLGQATGDAAGQAVMQLAGNPAVLAGGIGLVIAAALLFYFLKKIVINSILGVIAWLVVKFVFGIQLPLLPSLAVSVIFGLAGIGAMLVLRFFGIA